METFTHTSQSTPGKEYTTTIHDDGAVTCTCPGFIFRRKCRHIAVSRDWAKTRETSPVATGSEVTNFISPMLARALPAGKTIEDYMTEDWVMEEKHDGHRLIIDTRHTILAYSRGGKVRELPEPIIAMLREMPPGIYDGELIVPGGTSTDVKALDKQDQLQLVLFDILELRGDNFRDEDQIIRRDYLLEAWKEIGADDQHLSAVAKKMPVTVTAQHTVTPEVLQSIWDRGGEGVMVKNLGQTYLEGKRVPGWIKFKKLSAAELTVTGFEEGKNGPHSTILLRDDDGIDCRVKTRNADWLRDFETQAQSFIGRRLVISYQEKTRDGKYRHPMADHFAG